MLQDDAAACSKAQSWGVGKEPIARGGCKHYWCSSLQHWLACLSRKHKIQGLTHRKYACLPVVFTVSAFFFFSSLQIFKPYRPLSYSIYDHTSRCDKPSLYLFFDLHIWVARRSWLTAARAITGCIPMPCTCMTLAYNASVMYETHHPRALAVGEQPLGTIIVNQWLRQ